MGLSTPMRRRQRILDTDRQFPHAAIVWILSCGCFNDTHLENITTIDRKSASIASGTPPCTIRLHLQILAYMYIKGGANCLIEMITDTLQNRPFWY